MSFSIYWLKDGVMWEYGGTVTSNDVLESNRAVYGSERFDSLRFEIANFLSAKGINFTAKDVKMIAAMDKAAALSNPRMRVALVADNPEIVSLLKLYVNEAEGGAWRSQVCATLEEAQQWLNIPELPSMSTSV